MNTKMMQYIGMSLVSGGPCGRDSATVSLLQGRGGEGKEGRGEGRGKERRGSEREKEGGKRGKERDAR